MLQPASWGVELARELGQTQAADVARLSAVDPLQIIYPEGGWTTKDILGHLTTWEEEVIRSLQAHQLDGTYSIPDFELEAYNAANVVLRKELPAQQIMADWLIARRRLQALVESLSLEKLMEEMTYPSGRRGRCNSLVKEVMHHQQRHMEDIWRVSGLA
jgi:hypothetical protein